MRKRENPGLEFLDCPQDILNRPNHEIQTARIACTHQNVTDCFRVKENGVEGTIVQMYVLHEASRYSIHTNSIFLS
jgi:hypothetical protein